MKRRMNAKTMVGADSEIPSVQTILQSQCDPEAMSEPSASSKQPSFSGYSSS
jgi:hypothetical protein